MVSTVEVLLSSIGVPVSPDPIAGASPDVARELIGRCWRIFFESLGEAWPKYQSGSTTANATAFAGTSNGAPSSRPTIRPGHANAATSAKLQGHAITRSETGRVDERCERA